MAVKLLYDKGECVGCPPEMGCMGAKCPQCNVIRIYCDICNNETDEVYRISGLDICDDCLADFRISIHDDNLDRYIT